MSAKLNLIRIYSLRSLLGIALVAIVLVGFYRAISIDNLKTQETSFNVTLAQSLASVLWSRHTTLVRGILQIPTDETLADSPEVRAMHQTVMNKIRDLRVVKVKIYDTNGITVFSTDLEQIGEDKSDNKGFLRALGGSPASELVPKGRFSTFEQTIEDANVLSSYIPIRFDDTGSVGAVYEIYSDVTPLLNDITRSGYIIMAVVTTLLLMLYLFLLSVVKRADRMLHGHEEELQRYQQTKLDYLSRYDVLTDLPNRSHFMTLLSGAIEQSQNERGGVGIIYLSIDRFKLINDTLRHEYGDKVLIEVARRLRDSLGDGGVVARMGSDQFAVMSKQLGQISSARPLAEKILRDINKPTRIEDRDIALTASLGLAATLSGAKDAELLVEHAITAMHKARDRGRNGFVFYTRDLDARSHKLLALEMELRKALERDEFVLHYQPRVDIASGRVVALEALLRWRHPERGLVMPMEFIPILEDRGLMIPIGAWVVEEACRQLAVWQRAGHPDLRISVNLSLRQFRDSALIHTVRGALEQSGLGSASLELELTESVLADDLNKARSTLHDFKALGVNLAIDDFGTGYSSLSYLIHFPVDCLKIDRVFVADFPANKHHVALTTAIVAMAESLGLTTVAEGVETHEQYQFVKKLGCTQVQGFWFSKARPAAEIPGYISELARKIPPDELARDTASTHG